MKMCKFSAAEKKYIRTIIVLLFIQLLIILIFVHLWKLSQQLDISDTKQVNITVDDAYIVRMAREDRLIVVADSTHYVFTARATNEETSVHELYNSISKGDRLFLQYCEQGILFKKVNFVVDARSETEIYRRLVEFNRGKQGVPVLTAILYVVVQLAFIGIFLIFLWLHRNVRKDLCRKMRT